KQAPAAPTAADPASFERAFAAHGPGLIAGDRTASIPLGDDRTLWLFGDSFLDSAATADAGRGAAFIRNSAVVQDGAELTTLARPSATGVTDFLQVPGNT